MAKNQPVKQQPEAAAVIDTNVSGELAGESPEHLAADTPAIDPEALAASVEATVTRIATAATKVRVLVEGHYGKPDDVIELEGEALAQALASGQVDPHPDAVAYAEGLKA